VTEIDARVFLALHHALGTGWLLGPMAFFSAIGGGWGSLFVLPMFAAKRTREAARSLAVVLIAIAVIVWTIKRIVARARPCNCIEGVHALIFKAPSDFSFPSGHAAGSFTFCVFLAIVLLESTPSSATDRDRFFRRAGAAALIALAVCVGLSRIALGVHFPGDVLCGAIMGATVGLIGARFHRARVLRMRELA